MNNDEDLEALYDELLSRKHESMHRRARILVWKLTVNGAYALKRFIDIAVSLFALVLLFPLFLIIALVIRLESSGPVIFTQTRVGRDGRHFKFYKFRSMRSDAEGLKKH